MRTVLVIFHNESKKRVCDAYDIRYTRYRSVGEVAYTRLRRRRIADVVRLWLKIR
jgi:hypothetical protein